MLLFRIRSGQARGAFVAALTFWFLLSSSTFALADAPTISGASVFTLGNAVPKVDGASGVLTQHISLDIPPGRNGLQPDLSLDYNSQNTDQDSTVGYGWSLSIPYIERMNKTGTQDMYGPNAYFTSSLDGELVLDSSAGSSSSPTNTYSGSFSQSADSYAVTTNNLGITDGAITMEFWVNMASIPSGTSFPGAYSCWIEKSDSSTHIGYSLYYFHDSGGYHVDFEREKGGVGASPARWTSSTPQLAANTWYHMVGVYDGTNATLYMAPQNGTHTQEAQQAASGDGTSGYASATVIGDVSSGTSSFAPDGCAINGQIDDVRIYNAARTPTQLDSDFQTELVPPATNLVAYYPFDNSWSDSTTNGYNLTNTNSPSFSTSTPFVSATSSVPNPLAFGGTAYARVDDGSFRRYTYATSTNSWTMYDKNGTKYLFGASSQSQQSATTSPSAVYKWMLEKVVDTNGNYVRYTYNKDSNQIYPYQIVYTGHDSTDGPTTITFATSTRSDPVTSYKSGFRVTTSYRISSITAAFNGINVRQYNLSYTTGNNGSRSLLSSVQQTGWNEGGATTTLPATTFAYDTTATSFVGPGGQSIRGPASVITDIDGDGINDTTVFYRRQSDGASRESFWFDGGSSNYDSANAPKYWANNDNCVTCADSFHPIEQGVRFLDTNGDGKADVVDGGSGTIYTNTSTVGSYSWISTTTSGVIPAFQSTGKTGGEFADVNGTGLPSFVQRVDGYVTSSTYIANGSAWNSATTSVFAPPMGFSSATSSSPTNPQLVDINGDGLADWVYSDASSTYVLLNNGTGWESTPDSTWTISTSTLYQSTWGGSTLYYDRGIRFLDVNGDGLVDMVHSYAAPSGTMLHQYAPLPEMQSFSEVSLNTGHGWAATTSLSVSNHITNTYYDSGTNYVWSANDFFFDEFSNWTGNGQMDQDVLSTITNPKGGSTSVTYGYTTQSGTNQSLPYNLLVVTKVINHDGRGSNEETDYSYTGGLQYLPSGTTNSIFDRKFAGFASSTETHSDKTIVTYYNQGNGVDLSSGEQTDGYAQINHPYRKDIFTTLGVLVQKTLYRWDTYNHGSSTMIALGQQDEMDYASDGTHQDNIADYTYATSTDDLLSVNQYGDQGKNNGRLTEYTYAASSTINLSIQTRKQVLGSATSSVATSSLVHILVVGGGGSGGGNNYDANRSGGGGGGGGYQENTALSITPGTYTVTVGASDQNSSFGSLITALAGGAGATVGNGSSGGSGGGAGGVRGNSGGAGTTGQGYSGGNNGPAGGCCISGGGGGGGAGAAGGSGDDSGNGGNGGAGITSTISGTSVTYAGGGGGGGTDGWGAAGSGGSGGGGHGGTGTDGSAGTANTGGGGGGAGGTGGGNRGGGAGGSGVVIIAAPIGTLSASGGSHTTAGGNDIWTFVSSGTWNVSIAVATSSATLVSDEKYLYDNLPFGSVALGNQTKEEAWVSGTHYASSTKTYNSYGLVTQSTDRNGNTTTYSYDSYNLYPSTVTNPLSQATQYTYNYANGRVDQTTDPNGAKFATTYDGVGRAIETNQSTVANPATLELKSTTEYVDSTTTPSLVHRTDYLNSASTTDTYDYYDGLSRLIQERKSSETPGTYVVTDSVYNTAGLLASQSLPYFASGSGNASATATSSLYTHYLYDPLGRKISIGTVVATTTNVYAAWKTTTTDPNGNVKDYIHDAFNNLVYVVEHGTSTVATTTYDYDSQNNLTKLTDSLGNVRNFTYDALGRRLSAEDLHPTSGTTTNPWTYTYDDQGNEVSHADPRGQTTNYTFDALNRTLTEDYTGQSGTEVTYAYDSCTYGIGRMCAATTTSAATSYQYDPLGRTTQETKTIGSTTYTTTYVYDRQGNLTDLTYPDASQVHYGYNGAGLPETISQKESGGTFSNLVSNFDYAPTGQVSYKLLGNGVESIYQYDPSQLYRLINILTIVPVATSSGGGGGGGLGFIGSSFMSSLARAEAQPLAIKFALADDTGPANLVEILGTSTDSSAPADTATTSDTTTASSATATTTSDTGSTTPLVGDQATSTSTEVSDTMSASSTPLGASVTANRAQTSSDTQALDTLLSGKSFAERADIKGRAIANLKALPKQSLGQYSAEVTSLKPINGGVQAFVRAWDDSGKQIGFGLDGSVDTERIRIFNPPVLVPDPNGSIVVTSTSTNPETLQPEVRTARYREDPQEALKQTLQHVLGIMKNKHTDGVIQAGKVGSTTSVFYPDTGSGNTTVDGDVTNQTVGNGYTYSNVHDASSGNSTTVSDSIVTLQSYRHYNNNNQIRQIVRGFFSFDTSAIGSTSTVTSATLSLYGYTKGVLNFNDGNDFITIVQSTQGANNNLSTSDYSKDGDAATNPTEGSNRLSITNDITTSGYNNFTLSTTTGLTWINQSGITKLGAREGHDVLGIDFDLNNTARNIYAQFISADNSGTTQDPMLTVETVADHLPAAPTSLEVNSQTNPGHVPTSAPNFSAIFNDTDAGDYATAYRIQVSTSSAFTSTSWDSGKTTLASTTAIGSRIADVAYGGSALASSTTYYWRIKFYDSYSGEGAWSTTPATFILATQGAGRYIQDITFTYDAAGNITGILDLSDTNAAKTVHYTYDYLNRLVSASTTVATLSPYGTQYIYDPLGNLTNNTALGSYTYARTGYANPDAPTTINGVTYSYDQNGNVSSAGSTNYTWDYRNRLTKAASSTSSYFVYDHTLGRIAQGNGTATTTYPNKYYEAQGTTTVTKYVFTPTGDLVATIKGTGTSTATTTYIHADNLGSTNVVTDGGGSVVQTLDYYPYGSNRVNTGTQTAARTYIGQYADSTGLSYLNARYLDPSRGQFTSQDPMFLGSPKDQNLTDPQSLNSYAYAGGNPIINKDPSGKYFQGAYSDIIPLPFIPVIGDFAGISYTLGVRGDSHGISVFGNAGFGLGFGKKFSLSYSPGDSPQFGATINTGYDIATPYGGLGHSLSGNFFPNVTSLSQPWSVEVGNSVDEYVNVEVSSPTIFSFPSLNSRVNTQTTSYTTSTSPQTSINRTSPQYIISGATYTSSGQIATFTTPSGAVVTWGGQLISGPPAKK